MPGVSGLGEDDHSSKESFSSHYIKGTYYQQNLTVDIDLNHLAEAMFVKIFHCEITLSPFPYCTLCKEVNICNLHL